MKKPLKHRLRVGIIFGGKSAEHEVSLQSGKNVVAALDKNRYEPVLIGIDKNGIWHTGERQKFLLHDANPKLIKLNPAGTGEVVLAARESGGTLMPAGNGREKKLDVVFPVLHGTNGEDGTIQGLLTLMDVPFVGPGVLGSAVGMDKDAAKRLWRDAGLPIAKFIRVQKSVQAKVKFAAAKQALGLPMFVKPANAGSSVGVSKVKNESDFKKAVTAAFEFDDKILIEEFVKGREIEVGILGNEKPKASVPGEIIPSHEFYSYEAKYIDESGAAAQIPARIPKVIAKKIQNMAIKAFQVLGCEGMARVDFFLTASGKIYINEINTIPGFTNISMYPKLWEASGIKYSALIDRLIELAIARHARGKKLKTTF